jgi:tRNA (guanine37-N1)-methyltransferase
MDEVLSIRVPKILGEKAILLTKKLKINDETLKIQKNINFIYIPLIFNFPKENLKKIEKQLTEYIIVKHSFPKRKKRIKTYIELLENKLPSYLLANLTKTIDFVGNIVIIDISSELKEYEKIIGEAILKVYPQISTVLSKESKIEGKYRLRKFKILAGSNTTQTIHQEYGCKYHVDLAKAYFSPRLSFEHNRISSLVKEGEVVVDLFAGIGPFSILIAKNHTNVKIFAVDLNPIAIELLKKNILVNRVENKVYPILGDARSITSKILKSTADRVIMNLPEKANNFLDIGLSALKPEGGVIHFYTFITSKEDLESIDVSLIRMAENSGKKVIKSPSRLVRAIAPYKWQAVLDAKIINS